MAKKNQLSYKEIEQRLMMLAQPIAADEVGYGLLYCFGKSDRDIARYKEGKGVLKGFDGLLIKGLLCYQSAPTLQLTYALEALKTDAQVLKAAPKIVAVSDGTTLLAYDLRERDTYENPLQRVHCDFAFFYPLMDVERVHYVEESPADVKAAEKLAKLHDELRAYNAFDSNDDLHDLNIFITRLLFCFFAEDTGIFEEQLFTSSIRQFTKEDGSDLAEYLAEAFNVMDVERRDSDVPRIISQFPYVNGGLFSKHIAVPRMSAKARRILLECGELDWQDINPDIFGSMIQAVVNPEERASQGMHYTSVPNIMKVINPLFMDDLREEYNAILAQQQELRQQRELGAISTTQYYQACKPIEKRCNRLLMRMSKMKFFDPACGSGNFLIITYKCLRLLEMDVLAIIRQCSQDQGLNFIDGSCITIGQFYGIELLDFPHEVAMLSLWLAEHQMNKKMHDSFGVNTRALPLHNITQIVCGNACRIDWNRVCPHTADDEVFVFGNPPYLGSRNQTETHKNDIDYVLSKVKSHRRLDYIANWFYLGSSYIEKSNSRLAFVSTNSICQGEQLLLWDTILVNNEICFAYTTFDWSNNAKKNAGVSVVIIGLRPKTKAKCYLYTNSEKKEQDIISPRLSEESTYVSIQKQTKSISGLPEMRRGNMPNDKELLRLSKHEKDELISQYPVAANYIRLQVGSEEFINSIERYCLWISDENLEEAIKIPFIKERVDAVREYRINSKDKTLHEQAKKAHQFREFYECNDWSIIIPIVSSGRREYIPMGFLPNATIVPNSAQVVYSGNTILFGVLTSKLHNLWVKSNAGRMRSDFRYSIFLCYNTFPFPKISETKKAEIEQAAEEVLITRENYPGSTLADLYDPDKMPQDLREAHARLDDIVDSCYPGYPFANDDARLECLFKLYEKMTAKKD